MAVPWGSHRIDGGLRASRGAARRQRWRRQERVGGREFSRSGHWRALARSRHWRALARSQHWRALARSRHWRALARSRHWRALARSRHWRALARSGHWWALARSRNWGEDRSRGWRHNIQRLGRRKHLHCLGRRNYHRCGRRNHPRRLGGGTIIAAGGVPARRLPRHLIIASLQLRLEVSGSSILWWYEIPSRNSVLSTSPSRELVRASRTKAHAKSRGSLVA